ncbi:hypothetical protein [Streptomyces sp. NPDC088847]|uniref:hypothetical protein n=1 Tax=Streptomyces sp. NPDC088847 TaxID=3365909 RepID=UPI00382FD79A
MTSMWPPGGGSRRPLAPRVAAPREPVDPARIGRRVVQRQAKGMDAGAVAAALEEARFDARQASRHEDLADDVRGSAELAEWECIAQLLADAAPGTIYDHADAEAVVRAELAADAAAAAAREADLREAMRIAARADELQALRELGTLEQTEPREGDEAARNELTWRAGGYVPADVDAWLTHALAAHRGHYRDPAAREAAAGLLPPPVFSSMSGGRARWPGLRPAVRRSAPLAEERFTRSTSASRSHKCLNFTPRCMTSNKLPSGF